MLLREELKSFLILGRSPKWGGGGSAVELPSRFFVFIKRICVLVYAHISAYDKLKNMQIIAYAKKRIYAKYAVYIKSEYTMPDGKIYPHEAT